MLSTLDQFSVVVRSLDHRLPQYNNTTVLTFFKLRTSFSTLSPFNFFFFFPCIWNLSLNQPAHNSREGVGAVGGGGGGVGGGGKGGRGLLQYGKLDR